MKEWLGEFDNLPIYDRFFSKDKVNPKVCETCNRDL